MPVRHRIDPESGLILLDLSGAVTRAELFTYYSALLVDPLMQPGLRVLADCRRVTSGPSFVDLHAVANAEAQLPNGLRPTRAAVLVNKGWLYGLVRQFAVMIERVGIRVMPFVDEDEARDWLAIHEQRSAPAQPRRVVVDGHFDLNPSNTATEVA